MIVWLNGAFGCGKTATALRLPALVPGSRLFDPETVGYMLQPNLADRAARPWLCQAADLVVDTAAAAPDEVAGRVASALPSLDPGRA